MNTQKALSLLTTLALTLSMAACTEKTVVGDESPEDEDSIHFREEPVDPVYDEEDEQELVESSVEEEPAAETSAIPVETSTTSRSAVSETSHQAVEAFKLASRVESPTIFSYSPVQVASVYAYNPRDFSYAPVTGDAVTQVVYGIISAANSDTADIYSSLDAGFFIVLDDGSKYTYSLIPTAVRGGEQTYPMDPAVYQTLKSIADNANANNPSYVQWLTYMSTARISGVSFAVGAVDSASTVSGDNIGKAANILKSIQVQKGSGNTYSVGERSFSYAGGRTVIKLDFNSGVSYYIGIEGGVLYMESSDMTYGCEYTLQTSTSSISSSFQNLL